MKTRTKLLLPLICCTLMASSLSVYAQMTDKQVVTYVKEAVASGKDKEQVAKELLAKGVSEEQARRIYNEYANSDADSDDEQVDASKNAKVSAQKQARAGEDAKSRMRNVMEEAGSQEFATDEHSKSLAGGPGNNIFGHGIFSGGGRLSFEPNENVATPKNYILGPGDEIIIDVWGTSEATIDQVISPEGRIMIPQIGPVQLSGLSIEQATKKLKGVLSKKYSIDGQYSDSQISVTLGNIRTIQVNVLGEVNTPGTFRLSAFSTVFNALYRAGGVTPVGSLRNVKILREGAIVGTADLYAFLFDGESSENVSLQEGDAIIVPPYDAVVEIKGGVKRPMYFETKEGESVENIIRYAGGFASDASDEQVTVERRDGKGGEVLSVSSDGYGKFVLKDGDRITVLTNARYDLFENKVEIKGSVIRPGIYALGGSITGVKSLVEHSGGLLEEAFRNRAQIVRERQDRSNEMIAVALGSIMDGTSPDVALQKNDVLVIYDKNKIEPKGDLTINGFVISPGDYPYADGVTIEDLILMAGGLQSGASTVRVDVSRRIDNSESIEGSTSLAEVFTFSIKDGMMVDGTPEFTLKPYDIVAVRKSPTFVSQKQVSVMGEVAFPGEYTLINSNDRISDIVKRAGGLIPTSYAEGAVLRRRPNNTDKNLSKTLILTASNNADSTTVLQNVNQENFGIGIDLRKAIDNPRSDYDVVLRDGDILVVPSYAGIVKIAGEVLFPNAVAFATGKNVSYYIDQAGGFGENARKSKVYVVYMNGQIARGMGSKIEPGCVVMVPEKPAKNKMTVGEWLGIGTTAASLTTMIATIVNLIKK